MSKNNSLLTITGTQPVLIEEVSTMIDAYLPVETCGFSEFTFENQNASPVMAYVMGDLTAKHAYNLNVLKQQGCQYLLVFAEHLTVPAMCDLLRSHVSDVVLIPLRLCDCERLQDSILPLLGQDAARLSVPAQSPAEMLTTQNVINFEEIIQLIEQHFCAKLSLQRIARELNLSPSRISHLFKDVCGMGFRHYLTYRRLEEAETLLIDPKASITSVAFGLGFSSPSHFCRAFKESFGLTPKAYMSGNRQFQVDEHFNRYQHLRLTILPEISRLAGQTVPPSRMHLKSVG
ncbi:helix-turn-helix transcriptional regulator [Salinimonas sp. HHU 13199]|uniref:Helix-turn-helix transcriptional regulator n=1 Tax=Salinimonas profundi TaxID=2729140 RepID=A0ABR8LRK4_9ALTE|nr:AraC family transcriptional regulator [Salinimonas profundi]MBD3586569.1 helix-turn-helix transcriptional regulator [Salinimonas profundi]